MKNQVLIFAFISSLFAARAEQPRRVSDSQLKSVRIFRSGAQVTRSFSVNLEQGSNTVLLEGLSSAIDRNSIAISGTGDAMVTAVGFQLDYLVGNRRPAEVLKLEDSLKTVNRTLEKVNGLELVYNDEIGLMNANRSVGGANTGVDVDLLREVADFYRERMVELRVKLIDIHAEQKSLRETQERLNKQLAEWNEKTSRPRGAITIAISARQRGTFNLTAEYYTNGASWNSGYDIRANGLNAPVRLVHKAEVLQNTGEDWQNAHIILSTGNPSLSGAKPDLIPWYLDFLSIMPVQGRKAIQYDSMAPAVMATKESGAEFTTSAAMVSAVDQATTIDFDISIPYSIASDNRPVSIEISSDELSAAFTYYAAPKVDKDAFLVARVGGWSELDLLPGDASVYFEGNYVGSTVIDPATADDSLDISLGRDKRIIIQREKKVEFSKSKSVGGNIIRDQLFEISAKNLKSAGVRLILEDQIPVSRNGDIKVTPEELSGGVLDQVTGKVQWILELAPGAVEKRSLGFTVKSPKGKPIND